MEDRIRTLAAAPGGAATGEVVAATGLTRQAVHYHLARMVRSGELERRGAGRGSRYLRTSDLELVLSLQGLQEDLAWREVLGSLAPLADAKPNVRLILALSFT